MHLLVTDRLICPRCGPEFWLVLVSKRLEARRVQDGFFGCPNCREEYPIEGGFGDLRLPPRSGEAAPPLSWEQDSEGALRLAALLGVRVGPGYLLLGGSCAAYAPAIAALIDEIEVLASHRGLRTAVDAPGVSRMTTSAVLPFRSHTLRAMALDGDGQEVRLGEASRTLATGGRLVLLNPSPGAPEEMRTAGFDLLLDEERAVVGVRR
jgi:uncharacterized protein YbaR (Trm112 family)